MGISSEATTAVFVVFVWNLLVILDAGNYLTIYKKRLVFYKKIHIMLFLATRD